MSIFLDPRKCFHLFICLSLSAFFLACGNKNNGDNASDAEKENPAFTVNVPNSLEIKDYLPVNLKNEPRAIEFCEDYYETFSKSFIRLQDAQQIAADFENTQVANKKIDNSDAFSVMDGALNVGKTLGKGAIKGAGLLMTGSDLISYKKDYNALKKLFGQEKMDSLRKVIDMFSLYTYWIEQSTDFEMKKIKKHESYLFNENIEKALLEDFKYEDYTDGFLELRKEGDVLARIFLLNRMHGSEYPELVNAQVLKFNEFWKSEADSYSPLNEVFNNYSEKLVDLKSKKISLSKKLESRKNDLNPEIVQKFDKLLSNFDESVLESINSLMIYEQVKTGSEEIKKRIKKGSDVYF